MIQSVSLPQFMNFFHENGRFQSQSDGCPCCEVRLIDLFTAEGNSNRTLSRPKGKARRKITIFQKMILGIFFKWVVPQELVVTLLQVLYSTFFFAKFLVPILKKDN